MKHIIFFISLFLIFFSFSFAFAHYEDWYSGTSSMNSFKMPMMNQMMGGLNNQMMTFWYPNNIIVGILGFLWFLILLAFPVVLLIILIFLAIKLFKDIKEKSSSNEK